jgi:hypothetical protein
VYFENKISDLPWGKYLFDDFIGHIHSDNKILYKSRFHLRDESKTTLLLSAHTILNSDFYIPYYKMLLDKYCKENNLPIEQKLAPESR